MTYEWSTVNNLLISKIHICYLTDRHNIFTRHPLSHNNAQKHTQMLHVDSLQWLTMDKCCNRGDGHTHLCVCVLMNVLVHIQIYMTSLSDWQVFKHIYYNRNTFCFHVMQTLLFVMEMGITATEQNWSFCMVDGTAVPEHMKTI